jgi:hypothetical protein
LLVFCAPEKVSISPQRGDSFKRRRFCVLFKFSGTQPPLQQKRAYGRRGATCFDGRTNLRRFQFPADFCVSFGAWKKYAYGRRGGHIFTAGRTGLQAATKHREHFLVKMSVSRRREHDFHKNKNSGFPPADLPIGMILLLFAMKSNDFSSGKVCPSGDTF